MTNRVLICGRGKSLKEINNSFFEKEFDYVVLLNEFNDFVKQDEKMHEFLKDKRIIQFLNISESGIDQQFLNNYNVDKIYITRLKPNGSGTWWRQHRGRRVPESFGRECLYPSEKLEPYMKGVKNTADVAMLFSLLDLDSKELCFVGMDFYEVGYHLNHDSPPYLREKKKHEEVHCKEIKNSHKEIMSLFPETNFYYLTYSTFNPELNNCTILKYK